MEEARNNMNSWVSNELYHYSDSRSRIGMAIPKKEVHRLRYPPDLSTFLIDTTVMRPKDIQRNRNIPSDPQVAKRLFYLWGEDFVDINSLLEYAGTKVSCNICRQTVPFGTIPYDVDAWVEHWNNCEDIQMIFDTENPHNKNYLPNLHMTRNSGNLLPLTKPLYEAVVTVMSERRTVAFRVVV
ncbi:hypothetical protein K435DRAFT_844681 [Dendrothele bispora CBS 962.96]|uniref:Uncharacterized protein n=1 Tax=Dendrothele bispora (strain CBS 962.96) TaxID=1314807 RepID=A0A4S8L060_DENBC|nr:hypothetical protein K435DRAFT_844681 [Dendrothele bispora CBS 962.96]